MGFYYWRVDLPVGFYHGICYFTGGESAGTFGSPWSIEALGHLSFIVYGQGHKYTMKENYLTWMLDLVGGMG